LHGGEKRKMNEEKEKKEVIITNITIEKDLYEKLWEIVKKRYVSPARKFHIIVNEAFREYIERHKDEIS
jgi:metal-responsive CopG/Arc/MetJ family transcriptional regulator